jgi:hypothetical protein
MKRRDNLVKIVIALSALVVGVAFGRWTLAPDRPVVPAPAAAKVKSPIESSAAGPSVSQAAALTDQGSLRRHPESEALVHILRDRKNHNRTRELTDYVNGLSPAEFATALLSIRNLPRGSDRDLATSLLAARWAELDPEAALAFAAKHKEFDGITGDVFQRLASSDLQGALGRAKEIGDPNIRYQALRGALSVMAEGDPAGALQLAASYGNFPHNEPLSQALYRQWSSTDPLAAAAAAAQDSSSTGWRSPIGQVLRTWSNEDPQAALSYALTMSDTSAQSRSVSDIVRRWSDQDPTAAGSWINSMPAGPARDAAVAAFASAVSSTDLQAAVGWAQSISDDSARTSALQRVSRHVLWRDPTNGPANLQSAGVPPEILQSLPPPRR